MKVMNTTFKSDMEFEDLILDVSNGALISIQLSSDEEVEKFIFSMKSSLENSDNINVIYMSPRLCDLYDSGRETDYEHKPFFDLILKDREIWDEFRKFFKKYIEDNEYITCPISVGLDDSHIIFNY